MPLTAQVGAFAAVKVVEQVVVQPLLSVTVTVYVPALKLLIVAVVLIGVVFHAYVYGNDPPLGSTVALPLLTPQSGFEPLTVHVGLGVVFIVVLHVVVQPKLSVTVTVYVPALRLLITCVVLAGVVLHT